MYQNGIIQINNYPISVTSTLGIAQKTLSSTAHGRYQKSQHGDGAPITLYNPWSDAPNACSNMRVVNTYHQRHYGTNVEKHCVSYYFLNWTYIDVSVNQLRLYLLLFRRTVPQFVIFTVIRMCITVQTDMSIRTWLWRKLMNG